METKDCLFCGSPATKLCDFPRSSVDTRVADGKKVRVVKTCSIPMCEDCSTQWRGMDICPMCIDELVRKSKDFADRNITLNKRFESIRKMRGSRK